MLNTSRPPVSLLAGPSPAGRPALIAVRGLIVPLVLAACLAWTCPAQAKFFSTERLLEELDSAECTRNAQARGYILGVYDSFEGTLYPQHPNLSQDQLVLVVEEALRKNRELGAYSAQVGVMRSLEEHFASAPTAQEATGAR